MNQPRRSFLKIITALNICATAAFAQETGGLRTYESAPLLKASGILKPEILAGPNHRVLDNVSTMFGRNRYVVETRWGYFTAESDALLEARVAEANAMAEMQEVSRTEEYKAGLVAAAKTPLNAVQGLVENPKGTVKGAAKGVWKFVNRTGESLKNATKGRERGQGEDGAAKQLLGLSKAKRSFALQMGADPYSSNEVFQEQLEAVAWTSVAGAATFKLATLPISGGAGMALTAANTTQNFQNSLRDMSPGDLRMANKKKLIAMGVGADAAETFLANPAFSPTNQTAFVQALASLDGVKNRAAFVELASETASDESDAVFCSRTAQLLAAFHAGKDKMAEIKTLQGFPVAIAADGRLVVALQWDTAFWSESAEEFITRAQVSKLGQTGALVIAITGSATPRMQEELASRKISLVTHVLNGPQK